MTSSITTTTTNVSARLALGLALATAVGGGAQAHEDHAVATRKGGPVTPAALVHLENTRAATARFRDVAVAETAGYVDIGLFVPHMGWHYLNPGLLDGRFEADRPELLVYADNPCTGRRELVAVEYAVPLSLAEVAPTGFPGAADVWEVNSQFQLWTLHAWIWEYNTAGVFAPFNEDVL